MGFQRHKYIVIRDEDENELGKQVSLAMDDGFELVGGISAVRSWYDKDTECICLYQALVKVVNE